MDVEMKVEVVVEEGVHVVKWDPGICGKEEEDASSAVAVGMPFDLDVDAPGENLMLEDPLEIKVTSPSMEPGEGKDARFKKPLSSKGQKLKKIKPAICVYCHTGFPTADLYEHHMSTVHKDERPFACRHCGKAFALEGQCRKHETIHNPKRWEGEPQWECDLCPKRYHVKQSMQLHRKKAHFGYRPPKRPSSRPVLEHHSTKGVKNPNLTPKPKQVHQCPHCDLEFKMRCHLQKHMIVHTRERPFSCPICEERFPRDTALKTHIRRIHEESTPTGMRHSGRPRSQSGQPCPCTVCGKVFPIPSQLRYHMLRHTGEKPEKCPHCDACFRITQDVKAHIRRHHARSIRSNPLKLFKCLVCGKDNIAFFTTLQQHRRQKHSNVPYESEKEKPFACGVCGKPYFLREDAIICAALGHDSTRLRKEMFKHQCPECPPEKLGFWSTAILTRHWEQEHPDKPLPIKYRKWSYYEKKGTGKCEYKLPNCSIDRKLQKSWKRDGIPEELLKNETRLYTELPLLPLREEQRVKKKVPKTYQCGYCDKLISSKTALIKHENVHKMKLDRGRVPELQVQRKTTSVIVNVQDAAAVSRALTYQNVRVSLQRIRLPVKRE